MARAACAAARGVHLNRAMETTTSGLRILVAEDTLSTAFTLRKMLEKLGHTVEVVLNGLAAVDVLCDFRPQVVILDIGMPGMDGYEVTRRIRLEPRPGRPAGRGRRGAPGG